MVQSMNEMQPERFDAAMRTQDILNMTPLHRAALFDHLTVVEFLVKLVILTKLINIFRLKIVQFGYNVF